VALKSATGIGATGAAVEVSSNKLAASTTTSGQIFLKEVSADGTSVDLVTIDGVPVTGITSAGGAVTLSSDTTLNVNAAVNAATGVSLSSIGVLTIAAAGDIAGANGAVSLTGSAISTAGDISTTGQNITFNSPTTLTGNILVSSGAGNVTFGSTVDGGFGLTVNSSGVTKFSGAVGTTPLASITTDGVGSTEINTGIVNTTGNMTFNDPVTLSANTALTTTGGGNIAFASNVNADAAGNNRTLTLDSGTAGTISVTGSVGNSQSLAGLTITNSNGATFSGIVDVTASTGTVTISDTVAGKTIAFQNNLVTDVFTSSNGGNAYNVSFLGGSTQINNSATFSNTGTVQIGDQTADTTSITGGITHTAGPTVLAGGITVTGPVSVNATTIPVGQVATLNAGANPVTFNTTLDGAGGLVVNTSGLTTFTGAVGGITPLASLQTDAPGTTTVNGGVVTTNGAGGQTYNDPVTIGAGPALTTFTSGIANITFGQTLTGNGNDLTFNLGGVGGGALVINQALTNVDDLIVTAGSATITNTSNAVANVVQFNTTGNVQHFEAGGVILAASTVGGSLTLTSNNGNLNQTGPVSVTGAATVTTNNGSITTGGAGVGFTAGSILFTANDGSGTDVGTLTVGAGGITTTGGALTLKSADGMTINGPVVSNNGNIILAAGNVPGMASLGIPLATNAGGTALGTVAINAPVRAGTGNVTIYSSGAVSQTLPPTDAGVQTSNALTVRTYNDTAGAATITMENDKVTGGVTCATGNPGTGNCATQITLETRQAGDTGVASTTPFPGGFAASEIRYKSISGTQIIGIGTASDVLLEADSWVLNAGAINGGNVNIVATGASGGGNIDVGIAIPTSFINNNQTGGSLNLRAARDITILPGGSIGTEAARFDHNLVLAAGDDISIQGPIFLNGDLNLRANALAADLAGNAPLMTTGSVFINTPGATTVEVRAKDITIGDVARPVNAVTLTAGNAGTGQSADAILRADGILSINTAGNFSATGGTATASTPSAVATTADVLLSANVVNLVVGGNFILTGGTSNITSGAGTDQEAHAKARLEGTVVALQVSGDAGIVGGNATAAAGGNTASSSASLGSTTSFSPVISGDLTVMGGTSIAQPVASQTAMAEANAEIRTAGDLNLNIGGDINVIGGIAAANTQAGGSSATATSGAVLAADGIKDFHVGRHLNVAGGSATTSGAGATATTIAGTSAGIALETSLTLQITTGGNVVLLGGIESGTDSLASAAILAAGEIKMFISGPQGLVLGGGGGSDLFQLIGTTLVSLEGKSYPVTIQGVFDPDNSLARGDAFLISGAPPLNLDALLAAFLRTTDCVTFSGGSCTVPGSSARAGETTKSQAAVAGVCK